MLHVFFIAYACVCASFFLPGEGGRLPGTDYEVWGADQSNSAPSVDSLGVKGGFLWIWGSDDINSQLAGGPDARPRSCIPSLACGPCNLLDVFPQTLVEYESNGHPTGKTLGDLSGFGRFHGALRDPQARYVSINMFTKGGGFVGIMDAVTKEAVALFRVTKFNFGSDSSDRSVHMSYWSTDGSSLVVANLHGKAIERIDAKRNAAGAIISLDFNRSATLGLGKNMSVADEATCFGGRNAFGNLLRGGISGSYLHADLQDLTPNGVCKENDCGTGRNGAAGGRVNNAPICPIPSQGGLVYITLGGGGLLVADARAAPMKIVGEYGNNIVYGAGCGGTPVEDGILLNPGVSASAPGATQSVFGLSLFDEAAFMNGHRPENDPIPATVFRDERNTLTGGNLIGPSESDMSGQMPGITTRRDSHGVVVTKNGRFAHVVDRLQNVIESFDVLTFQRRTYDLMTKSGEMGDRAGENEPDNCGACSAKSVTDDSALHVNDPAPDLIERTPDGKLLMVALRGPAPVSVPHSAQGSCPGVGVVRLSEDGRLGRLVAVLRSTNTLPDTVNITSTTFLGGVAYSGKERSDVHGIMVLPINNAPVKYRAYSHFK